MSDSVPIANAYWVLGGKLFAGEYPGDHDVEVTKAKIRWLLELGITLWLDLTEEPETEFIPYAAILLEEARQLGKPAAHLRRPVQDFAVPTKREMKLILDALDLALRAGQAVYLHCHGGIGRTGTVVGCFLARHGVAGAEAVEHIARLRAGLPSGWVQSPETSEQLEMILSWEPGT